MSDPQTNVQIEDVLSSIRRLVSEEIGQMPARKPVKVVRDEEENKLVLSPAQKVEEAESEAKDDLWEATQNLAPQDPAPVWWHRDITAKPETAEDPFVLDADTLGASTALEQDDVLDAEPEVEVAQVEAPQAQMAPSEAATDATLEPSVEDEASADDELASPVTLEGALLGLQAARELQDDEWEPPEGADDLEEGAQFGSIPWDGAEEETAYSEEPEAHVGQPMDDVPDEDPTETVVSDENLDEVDDIPFRFRPGERLFERLSNPTMSGTDPKLEQPQQSQTVEAKAILEEPEPQDSTNIFDEDMLREMVSDIVRQELQGVLGERITRNVRKLVRREIQRALSDLNA